MPVRQLWARVQLADGSVSWVCWRCLNTGGKNGRPLTFADLQRAGVTDIRGVPPRSGARCGNCGRKHR